jgi:hypothetical protein
MPVSASDSGRRLALVIGNRDYVHKPLSNPVNDASDLANALKAVGFEAKLATNLNRVAFEQAARDFAYGVQPGDVALFYFSGHGMEVEGQNYLLPVDFDAHTKAEVKYQAQPASLIQELLQERGARVIILVLDACRDNPYRSWKSEGGGGLSAMSGSGVYVAFAAAPGRMADDNARERNGRFTKHLLKAIGEPGLSIDDVFNEVRAGVAGETGGAQVPFSNSGLIGRFVFRESVKSPAAIPVLAGPTTNVSSVRSTADLQLEAELSLWQSIKDSQKGALFEDYLRRYPEGQFAKVAKEKLEISKTTSAPAVVPNTTRVAIDTQTNISQKRPDYCLLPNGIDFDNESEHRDKLGIWTGAWTRDTSTYGRRFCLTLTSIKGGRVRGLWSTESYPGQDAKYYPMEGTVKSSSSSLRMNLEKMGARSLEQKREIEVRFGTDGSAKVIERGVNLGNGFHFAQGGDASKFR